MLGESMMGEFYAPDAFRIIALGMAVCAVGTFPAAVWREGRQTWWPFVAVAGCELAYLSVISAIADHFGEPLTWYRTPLAILASCFTLTYVIGVFMRKDRHAR